ncbi:DUF1490 family protein [Mycobacterium tuberculosis]|uniref:DUF1490 family protein n=1 Tax=Mycobacterium tuberculosis TaxID=1773 RepID=UPI0008A9389E|nr:DUF1490 family protein [Mycobacterium tuberculosis]
MVTHELLVKAAGAVLTGLVGVSAYETLRKALGTAAESARLTVADVVAEARGRIGEEAPLPAGARVDE